MFVTSDPKNLGTLRSMEVRPEVFTISEHCAPCSLAHIHAFLFHASSVTSLDRPRIAYSPIRWRSVVDL